MKNLIYQYWDGKVTQGCRAGIDNMKKYAMSIGAEYLFEENPRFVTNLGPYSPHYGAFKPIYTESFHEYDNILFADTDVFAVDGLTENIFEHFNADVGICTEPLQPKLRTVTSGQISSTNDEKWAAGIKAHWNVDMPRTPEGLLKVYNSGVVLYSNRGLMKAKERFVPFKEFVDLVNGIGGLSSFYTCDQPYLHAMLSVANMEYIELDEGWNNYIHHYYSKPNNKELTLNDSRTANTKFVHVQLRGADNHDADWHWKITNRPVSEWDI